jgi:uncharacterized protein (DUF1800 family)
MASLTPLNSPLGLRRAKHLLRRTSFKYDRTTLSAFAELSAYQAVNQLLEPTVNTLAEPFDPLPTTSPDGYWTSSEEHPNTFDGHGRKRAFITGWWWYNAMNEVSLKHKMTFFLHTGFTVGKDSGTGYSTHFFDHLRLLEYFAFGNLKSLAKKITLDNSMLTYLDNNSNNANNPNENYAREFLELFTILKGDQIGEGDYTNYTELDVQQAAKVFSGFKRQYNRNIVDIDTGIPSGYPNKNRHDPNDKSFSHAFDGQTITGRDDAFGMMAELDDFVEMVFAKEATAKSFCRKLYRFFVKSEWGEDVENDIITPLANQLLVDGYEIKEVLVTLLSSVHFYDEDNADSTDEIIGSIVKSPLQTFSEVCSMFSLVFPDPDTEPLLFYRNFFLYFVHNSYLNGAGMSFFNPDSVAGYPAHYQEPDFDRIWFSSNTLIARYKMIESLIFGINTISRGRIYAELDTVTFAKENLENPGNAIALISELADWLYPESIDESRIYYFQTVLLDGYDVGYWQSAWSNYLNSGETTTVKSRLDTLIIAMVNAAEFQLM